MARAFDLQDTLVRIDYNKMLSSAANPTILYKPVGSFMVISAQPLGQIRIIIRSMLEREFPNCTKVVFVSGSERQIIEAKARAIREHSITEFTDNNVAILTELHKLLPHVNLYKIHNGERTPFHG